jgi:hypothetical protein
VAELDSCSVCGRTILAGERTRTYVTPEGEERNVCELCRSRAEQLGWVWEELLGNGPAEEPRRRRRGAGLAALLRPRNGRRTASDTAEDLDTGLAEAPPEDSPASAEPPAPGDPPESEEREASPEPEPAGTPHAGGASPDPAGRGADVGRRPPSAPDRQASPMERAVERFNLSEQSRTVSGLMRTLGPPWISIGAAAGSPGEIRITVAWELSWYQWGVDLRDEGRPVYEIDKGYEVDQLDGPARHWNAQAEESGRLRLGAPDWGDAGDGEEA